MVEEEEKKGGGTKPWSALTFAFELGYMIAIPLVFLALLGRWADRQFETSPWFLVGGIIVATTVSTWIVYKKVSNILN